MAGAGGLTAWRRVWSASVRRRVTISALAAGLVVVVGWLMLPMLGTSQETRDARDVFCLQPNEQGALADAAVSLGVARPGSTKDRIKVGDTTVSVFRWRDRHHDDFVRACDSLSAVRGKVAAKGGSVDSIVPSILTVVLTSALTFATTRRQNKTTRGQADAGELRTAVAAYRNAANRFLDSRIPFPADHPATEMEAAREELVGRLNGVVEREPGWLAVRDVVELLRDGELGASLAPGLREEKNTAARRRKIEDMRARVRDVSDIGFLVADALAENGGVDRRLTRPLAEGAGS